MADNRNKLGKRILLVDDDPGIRNLLARVLATVGCVVVTASDGVEALAATSSGTFDLVVTDVVMPNLDGLALAARLRETHPTLPVLLMSGFSDALAAHPLPAGAEFLAKPIDMAAFTGAVRRLLASPKA